MPCEIDKPIALKFPFPRPQIRKHGVIRFVAALLPMLFQLAGCRMRESSLNLPTVKTSQHDESPKEDSALSIHLRAIAIDMHADTTQRLVDENINLGGRLSDGHLDAVRMREGGLDAQFFSIWVEPEFYGAGGDLAIKRADAQIAAVRALSERYPETWEVAGSAEDVQRIARAGKLAALLGLEGGYAIDDRLEMVERYYRMGVRYMSPAWSVSTSWAARPATRQASRAV